MRTRSYWTDLIDSALAPLGLSSSAVAEWKLLRDICITIAMALDGFWQLFQADINLALATKQVGGLYWYGVISRQWQNGDTLLVNDGVLYYATDNPALRLVTQVSAKEVDDIVVLKVAKDGTPGNKDPLSTPELTSFRGYIAARRPPGTRMNVLSLPADVIYYAVTVWASAGYDITALTTAVQDALDAFRNNFRYDAIMYRSEFEAVISEVPGVTGLNISALEIVGMPSNTPIGSYAELPSGYFNLNHTGSIIDIQPAP